MPIPQLSMLQCCLVLCPAAYPPQSLAKELRLAAQQAKRRGARVQDRLAALSAALRLLAAHKEGKATARLSKALDALHRVKVRGEVLHMSEKHGDAAMVAVRGCRSCSWPPGSSRAELALMSCSAPVHVH